MHRHGGRHALCERYKISNRDVFIPMRRARHDAHDRDVAGHGLHEGYARASQTDGTYQQCRHVGVTAVPSHAPVYVSDMEAALSVTVCGPLAESDTAVLMALSH